MTCWSTIIAWPLSYDLSALFSRIRFAPERGQQEPLKGPAITTESSWLSLEQLVRHSNFGH
jgi:hypothetical protein